MKTMSTKLISIFILSAALGLSACSEEEDDEVVPSTNNNSSSVNTPATYEFERNGSTSVSYSGQTDRLNQLAEIKSIIQDAADNGTQLNGQDLKDMYTNTNGDGNGNFSFNSTKQLKDKTFDIDKSYFEDLLDESDIASDSAANQIMASNGSPGLMMRSGGGAMLLNQQGHELTQAVEKGLMGAVFYHQIVNTYLTDSKIGPSINNVDLESGKNYTQLEHHFDEAFGYFGAPIDFSSNYSGNGNVRYWAKYSNTADPLLQLNDKIMNAYKTARAAIVENERQILDAQVDILNEQLEVLIAASSIHYINSSLSETHTGDRIHVLSEAFYFLKALRYSNIEFRKFSQAEVDTMLYTDFGENLWNVSTNGLNTVKNKLSAKYGLDSVKDQL